MSSPSNPLDPDKIEDMIDTEGDVVVYEDPNSFTATVSVPPIADHKADTLQEVLNNKTISQINVEVEIRTKSKWVTDDTFNVDTDDADDEPFENLKEAVNDWAEETDDRKIQASGGGGGANYGNAAAGGGGGGGGTFRVTSPTKFNKGDKVRATNTNGTVAEGTVKKVRDATVEEVTVNGTPLDEFWRQQAQTQLSPTEKVITVDLTGSSQDYDYPESQVELVEEVERTTSSAADMDPVKVAQECPQCGDTFTPDSPDDSSIEGDEGQLFCSLNCLHEAYT